MRYLGIDFGTKRVGLALSDETGSIATPLEAVSTQKALERVEEVIGEKGVEEVVVGDPGDSSSMNQELQEFIGQLSLQIDIPIHMQNEQFTSVFADQFRDYEKPRARLTKKDTSKKRDDSAAAIILQRFLDKQK
ncbi:MAG: putative Holliday junction resolvase [Candidatus Paceibacteria bacterium]|jgi:putative Holliday junction resolvase